MRTNKLVRLNKQENTMYTNWLNSLSTTDRKQLESDVLKNMISEREVVSTLKIETNKPTAKTPPDKKPIGLFVVLLWTFVLTILVWGFVFSFFYNDTKNLHLWHKLLFTFGVPILLLLVANLTWFQQKILNIYKYAIVHIRSRNWIIGTVLLITVDIKFNHDDFSVQFQLAYIPKTMKHYLFNWINRLSFDSKKLSKALKTANNSAQPTPINQQKNSCPYPFIYKDHRYTLTFKTNDGKPLTYRQVGKEVDHLWQSINAVKLAVVKIKRILKANYKKFEDGDDYTANKPSQNPAYVTFRLAKNKNVTVRGWFNEDVFIILSKEDGYRHALDTPIYWKPCP